jgi:TctA family transporter
LVISHGDPLVLVQRPISLAFLALTALLIVVLYAPLIRTTRGRVFAEEEG